MSKEKEIIMDSIAHFEGQIRTLQERIKEAEAKLMEGDI
jgi:hypothetical protein